MKIQRLFLLLVLLLCLLPVGSMFLGARATFQRFQSVDLGFRYGEICCAHEGINSFEVWNRECFPERYKGGDRPDMPYDPDPAKIEVHYYPPWHVIAMWWMGRLSFTTVQWIYYIASAVGILFAGWWLYRQSPAGSLLTKVAWWAILGAFLLRPLRDVLATGNYGLLMALCIGGLLWSLERRRDLLAGLFWALLMIKPQLGLLFFWPILFGRRFLSMGIAVGICLLCTGLVALNDHCSPIDLLLQIREVGLPYLAENSVMGNTTAWPIFCFALCGLLSFLFRHFSSWQFRVLPTIVLIPIWTYLQLHDKVILWPFILLLANIVTGAFRMPRARGLMLGAFLLLFCENLRLLIIALKPYLSSLLGDSGFTLLELSLRGIIAFLPLLMVLAFWWASRSVQAEPPSAA